MCVCVCVCVVKCMQMNRRRNKSIIMYIQFFNNFMYSTCTRSGQFMPLRVNLAK